MDTGLWGRTFFLTVKFIELNVKWMMIKGFPELENANGTSNEFDNTECNTVDSWTQTHEITILHLSIIRNHHSAFTMLNAWTIDMIDFDHSLSIFENTKHKERVVGQTISKEKNIVFKIMTQELWLPNDNSMQINEQTRNDTGTR